MSEGFFEAAETRISWEEFQAAMAVTETRFSDGELEAERVSYARAFLSAAFALEGALRVHARCALVNHYGSRGANNLADATQRLFSMQCEYAAAIRRIADRFRDIEIPDFSPATRSLGASELPLQVAR